MEVIEPELMFEEQRYYSRFELKENVLNELKVLKIKQKMILKEKQ